MGTLKNFCLVHPLSLVSNLFGGNARSQLCVVKLIQLFPAPLGLKCIFDQVQQCDSCEKAEKLTISHNYPRR